MPKKKAKKKLKRKKSSRRSRRGRRNPSNMVKPTPTAAQRLVDLAEKAGITSASDIVEGVKFPYHGELKDATAVAQAKIAFAEAKKTIKDYLESINQPPELNVHEAYKAAVQEWKDARKTTGDRSTKRPHAPGAPARTKKGRISGRAGNFRPITLSRAKSYLNRVFRGDHKSLKGKLADRLGDKDVKEWMRSLVDRNSGSWIKVSTGKTKTPATRGYLGARLAEAIARVGAADAGKILLKQKINAAKYAIKKNKAEQKTLERKLKKSPDDAELQKKLSNLQGNLSVLEGSVATNKEKLDKLGKVAEAAAARKKRARARARARMKKARARARKARSKRKMKKRSKKKKSRRRARRR